MKQEEYMKQALNTKELTRSQREYAARDTSYFEAENYKAKHKAKKQRRGRKLWEEKHQQSYERTVEAYNTAGVDISQAIAGGGSYADPYFEDDRRQLELLDKQRRQQRAEKEHKADTRALMTLLDKKRYILPSLYKRANLDYNEPLRKQGAAKIEHLTRLLNQYNYVIRKQGQKWLRDQKLENYLNNTNSRLIIGDPNAQASKREAVVRFLNVMFFWGKDDPMAAELGVKVIKDDVMNVKVLFKLYKCYCEARGWIHGVRTSKRQFEDILFSHGVAKIQMTDMRDKDYRILNVPQQLDHYPNGVYTPSNKVKHDPNNKNMVVYNYMTPKEITMLNIMQYRSK